MNISLPRLHAYGIYILLANWHFLPRLRAYGCYPGSRAYGNKTRHSAFRRRPCKSRSDATLVAKMQIEMTTNPVRDATKACVIARYMD
jgi:hypothetical protein